MGFSLPAAIGAARATGRPAVVIAGDGCFQLNLQELETVAHLGLPVKVVVVDNGTHGMVRQFQQSYFDGRYQSTVWGYSAPDFSRVAEAFGIGSARADRPEELDGALDELWADPAVPFLLDGLRSTSWPTPTPSSRSAGPSPRWSRSRSPSPWRARSHGSAGGSGRNLSQKVALNTALLSRGRVAVTASGLVGTIVATRYLGVDRFGQLLTAVTFVALFGVLTDAGVWTIAAREIAKRPQDERPILTTVSLIGLALERGDLRPGPRRDARPLRRGGPVAPSASASSSSAGSCWSRARSGRARPT